MNLLTRLLVGASALFLCSCAAEVNLLLGPRFSEDETDLAVTLFVRQQIKRKGFCRHVGYSHGSTVRNGPPFNNKYESTYDQIGCAFRFNER